MDHNDKLEQLDKLATLDKMDRLGTPRTVGGTIGGALGALFVVSAITFGATVIRPMSADLASQDATARADRADRAGVSGHSGQEATRPDRTGDDAHKVIDVMDGEGGGDEHPYQPKDEPKDEAKDEPKDEPNATPKPDQPADEPKADKPDQPTATPKPEPKPTAKPATTSLELDAWVKEGKVKLAWTTFIGDGFAYYKVVRSTDAEASWPLGGGDELVAAISDRSSPWAVDQPACGTEFHYRVFAVKHSESGYAVLAASNVAGAFVECSEPEPPAEPYIMGFEVVQAPEGVKLGWEQCTSDGFLYYKVVRSATNPNPLYPLNDGTELLAAIGDSSASMFLDTNVAAGQTWTYRVLSLAQGGDGWVVVGMTNAVSITVE